MITDTPITQQTAPATRQIRVVEDDGPNACLLDTARFEHMQRIAGAMAAATLLPDHLMRDKGGMFTPAQILGNCFLIVNQALRWGLDPFAVAPETYVVGGKLGFQGKLIAALINSRANLIHRLRYDFTGQGDGRTVTVSGTFEGETEARTVTLSVGQAKTANQMWTKDPDQKLIYSAATKWARRHCPEVMLGVATEDDLERIDESRRATAIETTTTPATQPASQSSRVLAAAQRLAPQVEPVSTPEPVTTPDAASTPAALFAARIDAAGTLDQLSQLGEELGSIEGMVAKVAYAALCDQLAARMNAMGQ